MSKNRIIRSTSKLMLSLISVTLLSITYFYWQPYDKCLFQPIISLDKSVIFDFITRVIYYSIYFGVIILIESTVFENNFTFDKYKNKKTIFKLYGILFAIRVIFDLLIYCFNRFLYNSEALMFCVFLLLESIFDIIIIVVPLHKITGGICNSITKVRKVFLSLSGLLILIGTVFVVFAYIKCKNTFQNNIEVWEYDLYYCNLIRDIIVTFSVLLVEYGLRKHKKDENDTSFRILTKTLSKIFLIIIAFVLINFIKFLILPHSMIKSIESIDGVTTNIVRVTDYQDAYDKKMVNNIIF